MGGEGGSEVLSKGYRGRAIVGEVKRTMRDALEEFLAAPSRADLPQLTLDEAKESDLPAVWVGENEEYLLLHGGDLVLWHPFGGGSVYQWRPRPIDTEVPLATGRTSHRVNAPCVGPSRSQSVPPSTSPSSASIATRTRRHGARMGGGVEIADDLTCVRRCCAPRVWREGSQRCLLSRTRGCGIAS